MFVRRLVRTVVRNAIGYGYGYGTARGAWGRPRYGFGPFGMFRPRRRLGRGLGRTLGLIALVYAVREIVRLLRGGSRPAPLA